MKKIYHLGTCNTCIKILDQLNLDGLELINLKNESILKEDLEFASKVMGSYEALFSKRAMKYRSLGLNEKVLSEEEMKDWILKEYTFLKRPMAIIDDKVYVGSAKKVVEALKQHLNG
jgi:arsenate reductase-like glutaredoxin family protein